MKQLYKDFLILPTLNTLNKKLKSLPKKLPIGITLLKKLPNPNPLLFLQPHSVEELTLLYRILSSSKKVFM